MSEGSAPVRPQPAWLFDLPGTVAQWHPTRNGPLDPLTLRVGSHRRVWWQCAQGHEWQAKVGSRTRRETGCPVCSVRRVSPTRNLAAEHPEVAATWHPTANAPLTPDEVSPASSRRVWWRCERGHEWQTIVANRTRKGSGCPVCSVRRVSPTRNLAAEHPEIATTWHPTANAPLTPDEVSPASNRRVWWQCAAGHEWQVAVANRVMYECPFCSGRRVTAATSLAALYPNVAREWHPSRNGTRTPETVKPRSSIPVWWLCGRCGHEWRTPPSSRTVRGGGCRECAWRFYRRVDDPLSVTHPGIAAQWHPTANEAGSPEGVTYGSARPVWWQCAREHSWETTVNSRTTRKTGCPYCTGKRPWSEHNLAVVRPELAREWHPTRNGALTPEALTPWSRRPVWWQCAQGHQWCAPPAARRAEDTCAMCAGKRFSVENNLARLSPKLAAQWHPSRNTDRTAASVTAHSSHRAWWRCDDCGHEWQASVNNRARGAACPVCALAARVLR